jgi:phage/conjugal plasmid C-4 type zinc finger TraR family protein
MDEKHHEQAKQLEDMARADAQANARAALSGSGQPYCDDCGEQIEAARRLAIPSAMRCVHCQSAHEHHLKGHAR